MMEIALCILFHLRFEQRSMPVNRSKETAWAQGCISNMKSQNPKIFTKHHGIPARLAAPYQMMNLQTYDLCAGKSPPPPKATVHAYEGTRANHNGSVCLVRRESERS